MTMGTGIQATEVIFRLAKFAASVFTLSHLFLDLRISPGATQTVRIRIVSIP